MSLHHSYTDLFDFDRSDETMRQEELQMLLHISQLLMLVRPGGGCWRLQLCLRRFDRGWDFDCATCCADGSHL